MNKVVINFKLCPSNYICIAKALIIVGSAPLLSTLNLTIICVCIRHIIIFYLSIRLKHTQVLQVERKMRIALHPIIPVSIPY